MTGCRSLLDFESDWGFSTVFTLVRATGKQKSRDKKILKYFPVMVCTALARKNRQLSQKLLQNDSELVHLLAGKFGFSY